MTQEFPFVEQIETKLNVKVGAPSYLNTKPLIYGLEKEMQLAVPSRLVTLFRKRQLQLVLAPIVEYFNNDRAKLLPEIAIASKGAVESVKLFYKDKISNIKRVALDSSSRTSELLLRLILKEKHQIEPEYFPSSIKIDFKNSVYDAILVIGDAAFSFPENYKSLDLGEEWTQWTQTPFVYACWMADQDFQDKDVFQQLLQARERGLNNLDKIISKFSTLSYSQAKTYLTDHIHYQLGVEEVKGIELFQQKAVNAGFLSQVRPLEFQSV